MSSTKRPGSPVASSSKAARPGLSPPQPQSLHAWLHPGTPPPIMTHSPPLHSSSSTFLSFSISFVAPSHITTEAALTKEVRRMVRELNVVGHVGEEVTKDNDGAFQDGEGFVSSAKGKQRAREPDHRMWAVRALVLKEGRDGTKGEGDFQLIESFNDDGEKFGGDRVLKVLREERGVDVLTVCCRWYGGDMIGPIRFQHIGLTVKTSLQSLVKLTALRDLREAIQALDTEIEGMRRAIASATAVRADSTAEQVPMPVKKAAPTYEEITDIVKLERLLVAREKTRTVLEDKVGWATAEQARREAGES